MTMGHYRRYPHGDPFAHFLLAQLLQMLANSEWIGMQKLPEGAPKRPPDPKALTILDFAPWLEGSAFHSESEWSEADEIKLAAERMLGALSERRRQRAAENERRQ